MVCLSGASAVSGGLVLRVLASGVPLLPVGDAAVPIATWLAAHGACAHPGASLAEALASALARDEATRHAVQCGRETAHEHDRDALTERLVTVLGRGRTQAA